MAQDLSAKRLNIASQTVEAATKLWDAAQELKQLRAERAVAGNFTDDELQLGPEGRGTDLKHLSAFMIGSLLDTHIPDLITAIEAKQQILLEVRR